ncbi:MAG: hypothetical protein AAB588_01045 [Patescibacteria group bacterium]
MSESPSRNSRLAAVVVLALGAAALYPRCLDSCVDDAEDKPVLSPTPDSHTEVDGTRAQAQKSLRDALERWQASGPDHITPLEAERALLNDVFKCLKTQIPGFRQSYFRELEREVQKRNQDEQKGVKRDLLKPSKFEQFMQAKAYGAEWGVVEQKLCLHISGGASIVSALVFADTNAGTVRVQLRAYRDGEVRNVVITGVEPYKMAELTKNIDELFVFYEDKAQEIRLKYLPLYDTDTNVAAGKREEAVLNGVYRSRMEGMLRGYGAVTDIDNLRFLP